MWIWRKYSYGHVHLCAYAVLQFYTADFYASGFTFLQRCMLNPAGKELWDIILHAPDPFLFFTHVNVKVNHRTIQNVLDKTSNFKIKLRNVYIEEQAKGVLSSETQHQHHKSKHLLLRCSTGTSVHLVLCVA